MLFVRLCKTKEIMPFIVKYHYLHRKVGASFAFALQNHKEIVGGITFGTPASRHLQKSVCPSDPSVVLELSRLWVADGQLKCTTSWFCAKALRQMPARLICSYADTSVGHTGIIYRALNFNYAGWTDEDRKTPRFDYVVKGKHSRNAFRGNHKYIKVRRKPKIKYWIATGDKREKKKLNAICGWGVRSWDGGPPQLNKL